MTDYDLLRDTLNTLEIQYKKMKFFNPTNGKESLYIQVGNMLIQFDAESEEKVEIYIITILDN